MDVTRLGEGYATDRVRDIGRRITTTIGDKVKLKWMPNICGDHRPPVWKNMKYIIIIVIRCVIVKPCVDIETLPTNNGIAYKIKGLSHGTESDMRTMTMPKMSKTNEFAVNKSDYTSRRTAREKKPRKTPRLSTRRRASANRATDIEGQINVMVEIKCMRRPTHKDYGCIAHLNAAANAIHTILKECNVMSRIGVIAQARRHRNAEEVVLVSCRWTAQLNVTMIGL